MNKEFIEQIVFDEIGGYPYRLKLFKPHPMSNVLGCIYINGNYYIKTPLPYKELLYSKHWHPAIIE